MSEQERSILNIVRLLDELIQSEKMERAYTAAQNGLKFINKINENSVVVMLAKIYFNSMVSVLGPLYPIDENDIYDVRKSPYA